MVIIEEAETGRGNRGTVKVIGEMTHSCRRTQNHSSAWVQSHLRLTRDLSTNKTPNYDNKNDDSNNYVSLTNKIIKNKSNQTFSER